MVTETVGDEVEVMLILEHLVFFVNAQAKPTE